MFKGLRAQMLLSLVLLLAGNGIVEAQAFGRVTVIVKDVKGDPLQEVKVIVTCDELERFREETETNKKGKAVVSFTDATKTYNFRFEYPDYQPADMPIKPEIRGNVTREVTLSEGQVVTTREEGGGESRVIFSPAEKLFNEGVIVLKDGDFAGAKTKFIEALGKNDKMAPAHSALAGVYLAEENYEAALASINSYMELEPGNPNGFFMLYDAHTGLGNEKEAEAALKALKEADRGADTVTLIYNAGVAATKTANYASARARFLESLELDPSFKPAILGLALVYSSEGSYQQAAEYAEKHLALEPGNKRTLRIRWDAYRQLGDEEKTKTAFQDLAAADPKVLATEFYNKGNDLFESGDTAAAIKEFERVLEVDPEHARAHYRLGVCHVGSGNNAAAKQHLQKFIEMAPEDPEAPTAKDMLAYLN